MRSILSMMLVMFSLSAFSQKRAGEVSVGKTSKTSIEMNAVSSKMVNSEKELKKIGIVSLDKKKGDKYVSAWKVCTTCKSCEAFKAAAVKWGYSFSKCSVSEHGFTAWLVREETK